MKKKISIIGAGKVGSTLAYILMNKNLGKVVLLDVVDGLAKGLSLDIKQSQGINNGSYDIIGTSDYADTAYSDIVVITAGFPRKPGMKREDLLKINAEIVTEVVEKSVKYSPNAIFIVVTNPLNLMTYLSYKIGKFDTKKIFGMAGVLDSVRLKVLIAEEAKVPFESVEALILGDHGDMMVPVIKSCKVNGTSIDKLFSKEKIDYLIEKTRNGGGEIVSLLKTGSAFYAPGASIADMIESIVKDDKRVLPISGYLNGEYGEKDIFFGVPCVIGQNGLEKIIEVELTEEEKQILSLSAKNIRRDMLNL